MIHRAHRGSEFGKARSLSVEGRRIGERLCLWSVSLSNDATLRVRHSEQATLIESEISPSSIRSLADCRRKSIGGRFSSRVSDKMRKTDCMKAPASSRSPWLSRNDAKPCAESLRFVMSVVTTVWGMALLRATQSIGHVCRHLSRGPAMPN